MLQECNCASLPCCERRLHRPLTHEITQRGAVRKWYKTPSAHERKRKGKGQISFMNSLPLKREKLCHLHCSLWDKYAPVSHLPVAPYARICHSSEYPSTFHSLSTDIISPKDGQKGYFSAPSPCSLQDWWNHLHESSGTYSVLWDTASIQGREAPYSSTALLWARQGIYEFVCNDVYSDTTGLPHTSVLTETRWDNGNPDCWKPAWFQFKCMYLFKLSQGFLWTLHIKEDKSMKKESLKSLEWYLWAHAMSGEKTNPTTVLDTMGFFHSSSLYIPVSLLLWKRVSLK